MSNPSNQLPAIKAVFANPELLARIVGHLDDGSAQDIVRTLSVSREFFNGAATRLCRRIEVPQYEYSSTKTRDEILYARPCRSCYGDEPTHYKKPKGVTAHRSIQPGLTRRYTKRAHLDYRHMYAATEMMQEMYKQVRWNSTKGVMNSLRNTRYPLSEP
jgi:hypothetical protein